MSALDDLIDGEIESQDRWNDKKMLYEAKKELAALRNPWQPIESCPVKQKILVYYAGFVRDVYFPDEKEKEDYAREYGMNLWMPLPKPPALLEQK